MEKTYDVVVIGGGVMGLQIAGHLRRLGAGSVAVLERRFLGAGESGKSGAILRQHYSHVQTIRMARASLHEFASFRKRTGIDVGFRRTGMLFIAPARDRDALESNVRLQRSEGVDTHLLDAAALRELEPRARFDDVVAAWEPEAAFVDPMLTVGAFGAEAVRTGAHVELGCEVRALRSRDEGGRRVVTGVETNHGDIATRMVVAATGPWSQRLLAGMKCDVPLEVVRPQQTFLRLPADFGAAHTIVADLPNEVYYKPEAAGTRVGDITYDKDDRIPDPDVYDESVSQAFLSGARAAVSRRFAAYERAVIWGGGSALYTTTPDAHAVIGPLAGVEGFMLVTGFSGHGFKLSPSVGRGVAESIVHGRTEALDLAFFDPARFGRPTRIETRYRYKILG